MKVRVSFTTKTIVLLLAMVLTVSVVISAVLIRESEARLMLQQKESQVNNQRRVQLFQKILHNRMITLVDVINHSTSTELNDVNSLEVTLNGLADYLALNFQVDKLYLFDEDGLRNITSSQPNSAVKKLVDMTRVSFDSRSLIACDDICTHYMSIPVMSTDAVVPVIVISTSMRELLSLFSRATDMHRVTVVQPREVSLGRFELTVASQLSEANRAYMQDLFDGLPDNWRVDDLVIRGANVTLGEQTLLVSLLPFESVDGGVPFLLMVQDISVKVEQNKQYRYIVISSAIVLFTVFSLLLYLFLNQYRTRLLEVSERLPMLAEHKFSEFYANATKKRKSPIFKFTDELDVVEDAANDLARQLESFDGQMAINTAKLEKMAMFDALTGLPNRNMLTFQIEKQLAGSLRDDKLVALMFMDLDDFKKVNDSYGHEVGDKLLKAAAMRISKPIRETDIASRFGGDEFVVLLCNVDNKNQVDTVAKKLINEFEAPLIIDGVTFYVSISIGIAITRHSRATSIDLLRHADIAMYEAKAKKGAEYRVYDATMNLKVMQKVELEAEARNAMRDNQFSLALQPQVHMNTGKLSGFEALLRWHHPTKGYISPADFIPLLEGTSFMLELDYWVVARATSLIRELKNNGYSDVKVAINMSSGQFLDSSLTDFLRKQIIKNNISSSQICLELTETALVTDIERAVEVMHDIRDMGCLIAIDDFGTGYSSLSYLKSLPADYIKIDRSFVAHITNNSDDRNIVHSIISMVRNMEMQVVAEGIETREQYELLRHLDCHIGQGNLISHPIPERNLSEILNDKVDAGLWKASA